MAKMKYYDEPTTSWIILDAGDADTLGGHPPEYFAVDGHNHDTRYFTETELGSITDGGSGADRIGVTTIAGLTGNTVQTVLESIATGKEDALGYTPLNAAVYTAADVLAKIKTVDGSGSGLDADLLDGQHSSYYTDIPARLGYTPVNKAGDTMAGNLTVPTINLDAIYLYNNASDGLTIRTGDGGTYPYKYFTISRDGEIYQGGEGGNKFWHAGNDGSGSGLNADLLDGLQASSFVRKDATSIILGNIPLYFDTDMRLINSNNVNYINLYNGTSLNIQNDTIENIAKFIPNGAVELYYNGAKKLETTSTGAKVTGDLEVTGDIIDRAKVVTGTYTGDDTYNRFINLGFTPKYVFSMSSYYAKITHSVAGLSLGWHNTYFTANKDFIRIDIVTNGFNVGIGLLSTNASSEIYHYVAIG